MPVIGATRGIWRALEVAARNAVTCSVMTNGVLAEKWPETVKALRDANLVWLVPAAVCAVGAMFLLAWRWGAAIIAVGGARAGSHRVISAFFVGEAGKYIPGAVWAMLGRGELARREGYERPIAYSSVVLSVIGTILSSSKAGSLTL